MVYGYKKTSRFKLNDDEWSFSIADMQEIIYGFAQHEIDPRGSSYVRFHRHGRSAIWKMFYRHQWRQHAYPVGMSADNF